MQSKYVHIQIRLITIIYEAQVTFAITNLLNENVVNVAYLIILQHSGEDEHKTVTWLQKQNIASHIGSLDGVCISECVIFISVSY